MMLNYGELLKQLLKNLLATDHLKKLIIIYIKLMKVLQKIRFPQWDGINFIKAVKKIITGIVQFVEKVVWNGILFVDIVKILIV